MDEFELWRLPDGIRFGEEEIVGYGVEADDGPVGTVVKASTEPGASYLVLAACEGIGSSMVMLPTALIERIDHERAEIHFAIDRDEIAAAPAFVADRFRDCAYRAELGFHYARRRLVPTPTR
jgi:hypothetical protein